MIRLAADNSPVEVAWAAFDAAAIRFHRMYATRDPMHDSAEHRAERMALAQDVAKLWDEWRALFLGDEPRPAA